MLDYFDFFIAATVNCALSNRSKHGINSVSVVSAGIPTTEINKQISLSYNFVCVDFEYFCFVFVYRRQ